MNKFKNNHLQYGFTIIEMVIVITITSILASVGAMIFSSSMNSYFTAQRLNGLSIEAEQSLQFISRELRAAQNISLANNNAITFTKGNSIIIYNLNGTNLRRSQNGGSNYYNISSHVNNFSISYFDNSLNEIATPVASLASIRLITIQLNFSESDNTMQLIQTLYLRNILA